MQLIHFPPDPRKHIPKVNLVAQFPPAHFARAQRVQRSSYDRRGRFLVVEDGEGGSGDDDEEDGETPSPDAPGAGDGWERTVGAAGHEGSGRGAGSGDEGAVGRETGELEWGLSAKGKRLSEDEALGIT